MLLYVLKRVLAMVPTLLGITLLTFLIITCAPGDPVSMQMGGGGGGSGLEGAAGSAEGMARRADAIKAKRKLLGMMESEHVVRGWTFDLSDPERPADGTPGRPRPMARTADLGSFDAWGRSLAVDARGGRAWIGLQDGHVLAVRLADGSPEGAFDAERFVKDAAKEPVEGSAVYALALSPDGTRLAASDGVGRIRVLDAASGRTIADLPPLGRPVRDLEFLAGGERFASACDDGKIRIHDARDGAVVRVLGGHALFVGAIAAAGDGGRLFSVGYDRKVRAWDLGDGTPTEIGTVEAAGLALALSPDGKRLAAGGEDRGARIFDLASGSVPAPVVRSFEGVHGKAVATIAFSPDGAALVTASKDGAVRVWRVADGVQVAQSPDGTNGEVFAALHDGRTLWTVSESDRATPLWKRYLTWVGKLAVLDFDRSFVDQERVIDKIAEALPVTLGLNFIAILLTYLVAVPVGVSCAVRRGSAFDRGASLAVFLLWALPNFFFATLLIQWFSSRTHWDLFPSVGLESPDYADLPYLQALGDRASHAVLPLAVLTYASFAGLSQYMRTSVLESISQDYVRTARAKGLSERVVVYKHALRNSLVTLVTLVGTMLPALIGGSVIVERIFSIQGMGNMGFEAIERRDYPVIMAVTTLSAVLTLLGMLISDILYAVVDPRISHK